MVNEGESNNRTDILSATVKVRALPSISLVKSSTFLDDNGDNIVQKGETITYTFRVKNTGNVTVKGVAISDNVLKVSNLSLVPSTLASGESGEVSYDYTIKQLDIDEGKITNCATAQGTDPSGAPVVDISGTAEDNNQPMVM